jgi:hypothetical protein
MTITYRHLAAAAAIAVSFALLPAAPALARKTPGVRLLGASVRSVTAVELSFNRPLAPAASDPSHYAISPQLTV